MDAHVRVKRGRQAKCNKTRTEQFEVSKGDIDVAEVCYVCEMQTIAVSWNKMGKNDILGLSVAK